jgi:hypothetical protein
MRSLLRLELRACLAIVFIGCLSSSGLAATITFQATDLPNVVPGEDLWKYEYVVSGVTFEADQGFSIYFDSSLYANLESPPPAVSSDWDIITLQPDPGLPSAGIYDSLALVDAASLGQPFVLTFAWLGAPGTTPGSQAFSINQFDQSGNLLSYLELGNTSPAGTSAPVPEPSSGILLTVGVISMCRRFIRKSFTKKLLE